MISWCQTDAFLSLGSSLCWSTHRLETSLNCKTFLQNFLQTVARKTVNRSSSLPNISCRSFIKIVCQLLMIFITFQIPTPPTYRPPRPTQPAPRPNTYIPPTAGPSPNPHEVSAMESALSHHNTLFRGLRPKTKCLTVRPLQATYAYPV